MRIERPSQACLPLAITAMALLPGCGRKQAPPPPPVAAPAYQPDPWAWHKVGGVLVVTGELLAPMELTLTGRHMNERIYAESGPIRWEFHAPPAGEVVTLRTIEGKLLATWNLDVPQPQVAQAAPPVTPLLAAPKVVKDVPWPETHLPLPEGEVRDVPAQAAWTWNPIHPVAPPVANLPAEVPWPETHLPLAEGRARKAPMVAQRVARALPAKPPATSPWPETHLPLAQGCFEEEGPAPVATWNPIHPAAPPVAIQTPPWPETHLPLAKGLDRSAPVQRAATPVPAPAAPPWPETHLPLSKGQVRITLARPLLVPEDGLRSAALPSPPAPPALRPLLAEAKARFWPDTHLPLARGQAVPAAPTVAVAAPSWPETHLPRSKGLFRVAAAKPVPPPPAPLPLPPPVQTASLSWPETHLPLMHGEPRKVAPKPPPTVPSGETVPPEPAAIPAPPVLPVPSEWPGQGEAFNLVRGPRGGHWVCITFDGGSSDEVALDVLNVLKERGICTTFFLTGDFIGKFPEIVRRIVRDGHEVGNHTMDHPHLAPGGKRDPRWTKERFQQQLLRADAAFLRLAGRPMDPYWRAPYGEQTTEIRKWAEELGYRHIAWSEGADTLDWATVKERKLYRTGNAILDRLRDRMERQDGDGLIVLMHLGSARPEGDRPARVLGPFLDQALDGGWNFVNIGAYLKEAGKSRWDATSRLAMLTQHTAHP